MRPFFRKASTRIVATGAIATLLMLSVFALIARTTTRTMILADLDDELETLSIAIASELEARGIAELRHESLRAGVETNTLAYKLEHHSAVVFDEHGVVAASGDLARNARGAALLAFAKRDERPFTAREPFTSVHRTCRLRVTHLGGAASGATLLIFRSIDGQLRTLQTLDLALTLFVAGGAAASTLILAFAVRRALLPVERITAFTAGITARDLSQRVEVRAGGEEFSRLGAVIDSLLARLQQSFESQRRLVSDAAHELKTPTAVIAAEAQELARGTLNASETKESLRIIGSAASGLAREVDDLLELARGDASSRVHERFALQEAIDEAIAAASAMAREREIAIVRDVGSDVTVDADRVGIVRAIGNLVINAVRYSPRASDVRVSLRVDEESVAIAVADRGPGVPAADRRRVFERFVRLAPARREHPEGSGLGLAIVEQVAHAHGGSAEVTESEEGGALFRVRIPRAAVDALTTSTSSPSSSS